MATQTIPEWPVETVAERLTSDVGRSFWNARFKTPDGRVAWQRTMQCVSEAQPELPNDFNTPAWLIEFATTSQWCSKHMRTAKARSAIAYVGATLAGYILNELHCRAWGARPHTQHCAQHTPCRVTQNAP